MTLPQLTQLVYHCHAASRSAHGIPTPAWRMLTDKEQDGWRMAVAVAVHQPWAAADIVRHARQPNATLVPWRSLPASERCHWQMISDVARAWRTEVTP